MFINLMLVLAALISGGRMGGGEMMGAVAVETKLCGFGRSMRWLSLHKVSGRRLAKARMLPLVMWKGVADRIHSSWTLRRMVLQGALVMPDGSLEHLRVGQQIGNYRLVRRLGQGGFAEVYLGQHLHLPVQAAIKLLLGAFDSSADNKKFRAEAQIVASLRHPHIVHILDFGIDPTSELPYLIMDYAPDGSLRQRHPRGTMLAPAIIPPYLRQIASALDFAHRHNIVHRDVKPENMLLTAWDAGELAGKNSSNNDPSSSPKILLSDFGIAVLTARNPEISQASVPGLAGTPAYMAPEQLRGKPVPASDQYSLAVVVYEWLCGQTPFRGTFIQVANQHINAFPAPPSERNPHISSALEDVILTALSKAPSRRYPSVSDFANAFAAALQPPRRPATISPVPSSLVSAIPPRATPVNQSSAPLWQKSDLSTQPALPDKSVKESRPPTRRMLLLALSGLVVAGGISAGVLWFEDGLKRGQAQGPTSTKNKPASSPVSSVSTQIPALTTLRTYTGHTDIVYAVAWSSDGRYIVSGGRDKTAQLWDARTANHLLTYRGHNDTVFSLAWSPDTTYIASGSFDQTVQVWNVQGNKIATNSDLHRLVSSVSWSPKTNRIAAASLNGDEVLIFDSATGNLITSFNTNSNFVYSVSWSPDGTHLAAACAGGTGASAQVWDVTTVSRITNYTGHREGAFAIAWSFDGKYVASGGNDYTVHIWRPDTGDQVQVYSEHRGVVHALAWSPKELVIASGSADKIVKIWTVPSNTTLHTYAEHLDSVQAVAWSSDGNRIASGSADKTVRIWQAI